jgi:hypothetical protein
MRRRMLALAAAIGFGAATLATGALAAPPMHMGPGRGPGRGPGPAFTHPGPAFSHPGVGLGRGPGGRFAFRGGRFRGRFWGPGFGLYAYGGPWYPGYSCWVRRWVWTPFGWRWRLVDVC